MDKLNWSLAVDILLACIVLWKLLQGRQEGMVKKLGSLAALAAAILAGNFVSRRYAGLVTEVWLGPAMEKLLGHARESLGLEDLLENLAQGLSSARLPDFLKVGVPERAADLMGGAMRSAGSAVGAASSVGWLIAGVPICFGVASSTPASPASSSASIAESAAMPRFCLFFIPLRFISRLPS